MGRLGYKPWDFHRITFREVHLAITGLNDEYKIYNNLLATYTHFICLSGFNAKNALGQLNKFIKGNNKPPISERAMAELKKLQDAGGTKTNS